MSLSIPTTIRQIGSRFTWDEQKSKAAVALAHGCSKADVAIEVGVDRSTIYYWLEIEEFATEVDRLSLMVASASRAQRLRWLHKTIANRLNEDGSLKTEKDVLDLLKFAQSETDGAKVDLSKLAELLTGESGDAVESSGPGLLSSSSEVIETTATASDDDTLNPS